MLVFKYPILMTEETEGFICIYDLLPYSMSKPWLVTPSAFSSLQVLNLLSNLCGEFRCYMPGQGAHWNEPRIAVQYVLEMVSCGPSGVVVWSVNYYVHFNRSNQLRMYVWCSICGCSLESQPPQMPEEQCPVIVFVKRICLRFSTNLFNLLNFLKL